MTKEKKCYIPENMFREWNSVGREQRMRTLSLLCGVPRTSEEGKDSPVNKSEVLAIHFAQVQRRDTLYDKRNHPAMGLPSADLDLDYPRSDPLRKQVSVQHLDSR